MLSIYIFVYKFISYFTMKETPALYYTYIGKDTPMYYI